MNACMWGVVVAQSQVHIFVEYFPGVTATLYVSNVIRTQDFRFNKYSLTHSFYSSQMIMCMSYCTFDFRPNVHWFNTNLN